MKPFKNASTNKSNENDDGRSSLVIEKCVYCAIVLIFLSVFSSQLFAEEVSYKAYSQGQSKADDEPEQLLTTEVKQKSTNDIGLINNTNEKKTREQVIADKRAAAKSKKSAMQAVARNNFYDFAIYSASTKLLEDDDGDGYYNTFGILFDADVVSNQTNQLADVYAEIYLSQDGGPWFHLYTTDVFTLFGDTVDDEYEVVTHLAENYASDYYNVLIDLYEPGYDGIVATYSADDSNLLYGLPLESQDYEYHEEHHHDHGGTWSLFSLLSLFSLWMYRRTK